MIKLQESMDASVLVQIDADVYPEETPSQVIKEIKSEIHEVYGVVIKLGRIKSTKEVTDQYSDAPSNAKVYRFVLSLSSEDESVDDLYEVVDTLKFELGLDEAEYTVRDIKVLS